MRIEYGSLLSLVSPAFSNASRRKMTYSWCLVFNTSRDLNGSFIRKLLWWVVIALTLALSLRERELPSPFGGRAGDEGLCSPQNHEKYKGAPLLPFGPSWWDGHLRVIARRAHFPTKQSP